MRMGMVIIMGAIAPSYPLPAMTRIISVAKKWQKLLKGWILLNDIKALVYSLLKLLKMILANKLT